MGLLMENYSKTRLAVMFASAACGTIVLIMSASLLTSINFTFLTKYSSAFTLGGGDSQLSMAVNSLGAAVAGGAIMVASVLPGLIGAFTKIRFFLILYIILSVVGSFVSVIGGGIFLGVPGHFGEQIYLESRNTMTTPLVGFESDLSDFGLALYNGCCVPKNWTALGQAKIKACTGVPSVDCLPVTDPRVAGVLPGATGILCMCAGSQAKLTEFENAIEETDGLCTAAEDTLVDLVGVKLPKKALSLDLRIVSMDLEGITYEKVPLVGWFEGPSTNPSPTPIAYPFGCGFGYAKGLAFMIDLWFRQNTVTPATAAIALGVVNLLVLFFGALVATISSAEEAHGRTGKVSKWDQVADVPAAFAQTTVPSQSLEMQQHDSKGMQLQSPEKQQQFSAPNPQYSNGGADAGLFDKVSAFYAKYEPSKSVADVEDVTKWTHINGVAALNAKLQSKYQSDLNSMSSDPAPNKGAKALDGDVDL
ncbi:hypothetical protein BASA81_001114 [Batrachochytrium salamandrivorans]|nr:hypothetical protein BASA81_001114 [Batrachochytrium salamandrivorans]